MNSKQPIVCLSSLFSHIHLIFYILVIFLTSTTISVGQNETDHQALLNIKLMITHDPYGALTSWNNSMHFYDWVGVTCGKRHRRVTYLRLISQAGPSPKIRKKILALCKIKIWALFAKPLILCSKKFLHR
ncbi:putative non-specific serine/threonine protein kinase [Helianthus anomalus]